MNTTLLLKTALNENNLSLTDATQQQLIHYLRLLQTWNRVFNLTAITNPRETIYLHIIDSLMIHPYLHGSRFLDVGSGAGLPGIPLALLFPEKKWVLLDKNSKKTRFLTQVVAELGLKNVDVQQGRCEDFHPPFCFDTILSRAFGTLRLFLEKTEHLLCPDGIFIAMKGKYPEAELSDLPNRFTTQQIARLEIKGMHVERHLVCLRK